MLKTQATVAAQGAQGPLLLHKLTDAREVADLRAVLRDLACDDSPHHRFPGPNPVSLDTTHFAGLKSQPYYVCEKTDGVRYLLMCCTVLNPLAEHGHFKLAVLIDRAFGMYVLPIARVPKALFQGTLLDGELVWNMASKRWEYLVFDALCVSGIPVLDCALPTRLKAVHRGLHKYSVAPSDPVALGVKTFVPCSKMGDAEAHLRHVGARYETDGIILTPAITPVVYGRHMGMFKLKFNCKHTVDFMVGQDGRQLHVFDAGRHVPVGNLNTTVPPGTIAECALSQTEGVWNLVTVRTDKTTANDMFTYQKTLLNMREKLTFEHIKQVFEQK